MEAAMFVDAVILGVFGTWWGVVEFAILVTIVAVISFFGTRVLKAHFMSYDKKKGVPVNMVDDSPLFKMAMKAVDTSAVAHTQEEVAEPDIENLIRKHAEDSIQAAGGGKLLLNRVMKRTAAQIGLSIGGRPTAGLGGVPPFKTVDMRINPATESLTSSVVKISIVDGVLPDTVPLPFTMVVTASSGGRDDDGPDLMFMSWPPGVQGGDTLVFDNIHVESLAEGIILDAKDKQTQASIFDPHNKVQLKMEAYSKDGFSKTVLYEGITRVYSPVPRIDEIMSCRNFALLRTYAPACPCHYSDATLDTRYVSEYPKHMPSVSAEALTVAAESSDTQLRTPAVAFIYAKGEPPAPLTHELYKTEIKNVEDHPVYTVKTADRVSVLHDPSRPGERYVSMSVDAPENYTVLVGWVLGFESGVNATLSGDGGFNVVFPANRGPDGFADLNFEDAVTVSSRGLGEVVLHNTGTHIGCFGTEEEVAGTVHDWAGPVEGQRFFGYHLRPVVVIRYSESSPPRIGAIMSAPATNYAGTQTTGLLPRSLAVSEGALPADDANRIDMAILGGDDVTFVEDADREKLVAVFPTLRTRDGLVEDSDEPYAPLHSLMSQNNTRALNVKKLQVSNNTTGGHAIISVFDEQTDDTLLGGALVNFAAGGPPRPIFVDGARDDRPFSVSVHVFDDTCLPVRVPGRFRGNFLDMTQPGDEPGLWADLSGFTPTPTEKRFSTNSSVVFCRTTFPPISDRGVREPFMILSSLVTLPRALPSWAFMGTLQNKFPRHIFVSSVRNSHWVKTIINQDGSLFTAEQWILDNLQKPTRAHATTVSEKYIEGERVYARAFMGDGVSDQEVDQAIGTRNVAWIVTENGSVKENMLFNDERDDGRLVGDWGIVVFGANPHPDEPADRFTNWRTTGRLRMVVSGNDDETVSISQPVTPLQTRLATWPRGEPVYKTAGGDTLVRLDPRIGGVGSANGFYNKEPAAGDPAKLTTSLLFVLFDARKVKYVERAPLLWKLGPADGLIPIDRSVVGQNRMWSRTMYDHDKLFLCVKVPEAAKPMHGSFMFIDNLVFACAASVSSPENRASFYTDFATKPTVIFNQDDAAYSVYVPYNFATTCGFVI